MQGVGINLMAGCILEMGFPTRDGSVGAQFDCKYFFSPSLCSAIVRSIQVSYFPWVRLLRNTNPNNINSG